jgi:hypothetical protein
MRKYCSLKNSRKNGTWKTQSQMLGQNGNNDVSVIKKPCDLLNLLIDKKVCKSQIFAQRIYDLK